MWLSTRLSHSVFHASPFQPGKHVYASCSVRLRTMTFCTDSSSICAPVMLACGSPTIVVFDPTRILTLLPWLVLEALRASSSGPVGAPVQTAGS